MKTAMEFYCEYYEHDEMVSSLQSRLNFSGLLKNASPEEKKAIKKVKKFKPKYSNDYKLELVFREILDQSNPYLRDILEKLFIVTEMNDGFQSYVRKHKHEFEGEIIFFNIGLSNAIIFYCYLYTILFEMFMNFDSKNKFRKLKKKLLSLSQAVASDQEKWREQGVLRYNKGLSRIKTISKSIELKSVAPSAAANKFVIGHEIAHIVLGHLNDQEKFLKEFFGVRFGDVIRSSEAHQREFFCDMFSMLLISGAYKYDNLIIPNKHRFNIETAVGSQIALTVFGQQANPLVDYERHPSVHKRYSICVNLLSRFMDSEVYHACFVPMRDLHGLLYRTQGIGLGCTLDKNYIPLWTENP